jgi:hypothetical protein
MALSFDGRLFSLRLPPPGPFSWVATCCPITLSFDAAGFEASSAAIIICCCFAFLHLLLACLADLVAFVHLDSQRAEDHRSDGMRKQASQLRLSKLGLCATNGPHFGGIHKEEFSRPPDARQFRGIGELQGEGTLCGLTIIRGEEERPAPRAMPQTRSEQRRVKFVVIRAKVDRTG